MSVDSGGNDRKIIDSWRRFNGPVVAQSPRNLKSAGEDYSGVVSAHFGPNSASTIDFRHENGAGLGDFAILGNNKVK